MRQAVKSMRTLHQIYTHPPSQKEGWFVHSNQPSSVLRARHLSVVEVFDILQSDVPNEVNE